MRVGKPETGDRIVTGPTTEKEWAPYLFGMNHNDHLVYPIIIGEMIEDEHGNVIYTYYGE